MTTAEIPKPRLCPKCKVRLRTIASRRIGESQQRRMECKVCRYRETVIVPAEWCWRRGQ